MRAAFSDRDPAADTSASLWADNLSLLEWAELELTVDEARGALAPARLTVLGTRAWAQAVRLRWRADRSDRVVDQTFWLEVVPDGAGVRLGSPTDQPGDLRAVPILLLEPVRRLTRDTTAVWVADADRGSDWLAEATAAVGAVRARVQATGLSWDERLVLQVPSSRPAFERLLGVAPGSYTAIAAAAWPMGPLATAAVPVVVNPELAERIGPAGRAVLLAHETVHVATRSVDSPAPTWLVEGYADQIAYSAHPQGQAAAAAPALRRVRRSGPPRSLPADADFEPGAAGLDEAYALAWLLCRHIAERFSARTLDRCYGRVDQGSQLVEVVASELGLSQRALIDSWGRDLVRLTRDPPW